jgi:protein gp37
MDHLALAWGGRRSGTGDCRGGEVTMTRIEWADVTWNPVTGCTKVSAGCKNCYAERMALRLNGRFGYPKAPDHFDVTLHPDRLERPLHWGKARRVFVCSMSDPFHHEVPFTFIKRIWNIIAACEQHTFMILTKRANLMNQAVNALVNLGWTILPNLWLGVTVEDQETADERIPLLQQTPAAVRFVSWEPGLGPVGLSKYLNERTWPDYSQGVEPEFIARPGLNWVIAGGETGPGARPMDPNWARGLRDQCQAAGVPFFFKSWGDWLPYDHNPRSPMYGVQPDYYTDSDAGYSWTKVGKKVAGRLLDGREWNEMPGGGDDCVE